MQELLRWWVKTSPHVQEGEKVIAAYQQKQGHLEVIATIAGRHIQCNTVRHVVIIDGVVVACSPGEYRVLLPLLHHPERAVPFALLLEGPYDPGDWRIRHNLGRVVSRLRAKLWPFGFDILCLVHHGYQLSITGGGPEAERRRT